MNMAAACDACNYGPHALINKKRRGRQCRDTKRQRYRQIHKPKWTPLGSFGPQSGDKNITNIVYR